MANGSKIEDFAEELGKMLGTAEAKARGWIGQRQQITKTLEGIRDSATKLLGELGHQAQAAVGCRRGRPPWIRNCQAWTWSAKGIRQTWPPEGPDHVSRGTRKDPAGAIE